jgi:hypothetical protein
MTATPRTSTPRGPAALALAALTCVLTACASAGAADPGSRPAPISATAGMPDLARLTVAPEGSGAGYRRSEFGHGWTDTDRNGCLTRDDILSRDLIEVSRRSRCVVVAGVLTDPYTGQRVQFSKGRPDRVQIDHIVALAEAWRSGADRWTPDLRVQFANDPLELLATAGAVNDGKGDQDAGTWSPADRHHACVYARRVLAVKVRYSLTVDRRERDALAEDVAGCP